MPFFEGSPESEQVSEEEEEVADDDGGSDEFEPSVIFSLQNISNRLMEAATTIEQDDSNIIDMVNIALKPLQLNVQAISLQTQECSRLEVMVSDKLQQLSDRVNRFAQRLTRDIDTCRDDCRRKMAVWAEKSGTTCVQENKVLGLLSEEQKRLSDERGMLSSEKEHFQQLMDEWEKEKADSKQQNGWQTSKIILNVGGRRFETSKDTLTRFSDNFFSRLLSGSFKLITDPDGSVFIDRDGSCFEYVLNYLRDGNEVILPEDRHQLLRIAREARFYGMEELEEMAIDRTDKASKSPAAFPAPSYVPVPPRHVFGNMASSGLLKHAW